jgi:hypothetical protein
MAQIAGTYQLTKFQSVSYNNGATQDLTSTLTNCELSGIYHFKTDGTATYTESINCSSIANGTWNLSNGSLYTLFTSEDGNRISSTSITSWDCTNLVLLTSFPSVEFNYRYTLTKQ